VCAPPGRRGRPRRGRVGLGAVRGGRRPRQGPAAARRRPGPRPAARPDAVQPAGARHRPAVGLGRLRDVGPAGTGVVRAAGPGAGVPRGRHPAGGRGAVRGPLRPGGGRAADAVRLEL
ncbi:MAG: RNA 3'-terminal phosphate cyclase, partial [uncultured Corynebacteriales bacterium]